MDEKSLSACCRLEFFKGTGNGGQKRNKSSSAVRVRLEGTPYTAEDCTERSQHRNRAAALRKLKLTVAFGERQSPAQPPERPECAVDHEEYPVMLAHLLDLCEEAQWELRPVAEALRISPSALLKLLARDPALWQHAVRERLRRGKTALRRP